ncbi:MAG: biotin/lipoyl-binding protein [Chloroflexi bacterium]|nr:biotin/lipoyl-binding protein [Chloroflexota bacterium]
MAGRVPKLYVDVGSAVKASDVLAGLEQDALAAQVDQAKAGLAAGEAKLAGSEAGARPSRVVRQPKAAAKTTNNPASRMPSLRSPAACRERDTDRRHVGCQMKQPD